MLISEPILFHPLKHHQRWISAFIHGWITEKNAPDISHLKNRLLTIGASQMDLYVGELTPQEIADEIIVYLCQAGKITPTVYQQWLQQHLAGYALVRLSDGADWVLRMGEDPGRFVHIHPARYAEQTIRVKAGALKTAIAALIRGQLYGEDARSLATINQSRKEWLAYSPIKSVQQAQGIERLIDLFSGGADLGRSDRI